MYNTITLEKDIYEENIFKKRLEDDIFNKRMSDYKLDRKNKLYSKIKKNIKKLSGKKNKMSKTQKYHEDFKKNIQKIKDNTTNIFTIYEHQELTGNLIENRKQYRLFDKYNHVICAFLKNELQNTKIKSDNLYEEILRLDLNESNINQTIYLKRYEKY